MAQRGEYPFNRIAVRVRFTYVIPRRAWERFLAGEFANESAAPADSR
jgi:hypothetical protein